MDRDREVKKHMIPWKTGVTISRLHQGQVMELRAGGGVDSDLERLCFLHQEVEMTPKGVSAKVVR